MYGIWLVPANVPDISAHPIKIIPTNAPNIKIIIANLTLINNIKTAANVIGIIPTQRTPIVQSIYCCRIYTYKF